MPLIRPASLPLIRAAEGGSDEVGQADAAARALREDYERWSRLGWGALTYLGAVLGTLFGLAMLDAASDVSGGAGRVVVLAIGGAALTIAVVCLLVLHRLWRTGRRLTIAAAWWLRLPFRTGQRSRRAPFWFAPRTVQYEPRILTRTTAGALLLLVAIFGLSSVFFTDAARMPLLTAAMVSIGVIAALCVCGILGGIMRITSGLAEGDPLWTAVRDRVRGE
ncbi:MAG: hypothetical protein BGN97_16700 [Microbacterium sp. 69-10]|uniref:hypothetical protein n=1 Tax=Microbacterium sp. 69-10 TaxID=1895783 RepID=UPI0009626D3F|nr:hypothetical protein [Microbacterium sp. 69-10]OJU40824.1 MAG: hypothetical protein BGN97_16700 [Microbacterium sp. 69-10]